MSVEGINEDNEEKVMKEDCRIVKPIRVSRRLHRKNQESKYKELKVYSTSNLSSKERLQKLIMESKERVSIFIDIY